MTSLRRARVGLVGLVIACAPAAPEPPTVGGVVTYRQAVELPETARLIVTLADVTRPAAVVLAEDTLQPVERPTPFELPYDTSAIDTTHVYAVAASIVIGEDVIFTSASSYEVITGGNPLRVEIPVVPASVMGPLPPRAGEIAARLPSYRRVDGTWEDGDAASVISAYFADGALRYVEERVTIGEHGSAANAYYFDQGALFYHETIKRLSATDPQTEPDEIAFRVLFGPDGALAASAKWMNGRPAALEDADLRSALRHAAVLREAALRLAADGS